MAWAWLFYERRKIMSTLKLKFTKLQYTSFMSSLKGSMVEIISDKDKAELVKDIIVKLLLRLMRRYDTLKFKNNIVTLNRLEMVAYRALMTVNYGYMCSLDKVIIMEVLTAIDKKEIYSIKALALNSDNSII
jgi:hypothetical protein